MAIYHLTAKVCKSSAKNKINYIFREGKYSKGSKAEELVYKQSANLPEWAKSPQDFFREMDKQEKGVKCREIEFALPEELPLEENILLAENFTEKILGKNHVYAFAIHQKGYKKNPHVHLVFSDRLLEEYRTVPKELFCRQRSGYKKDAKINGSNRKQWLLNIRKEWADMCNQKLQENHLPLISEKSYKNQGITKKPTIHLGLKSLSVLKKDKENSRIKKYELSLAERIAQEVDKVFDYQKEINKARPGILNYMTAACKFLKAWKDESSEEHYILFKDHTFKSAALAKKRWKKIKTHVDYKLKDLKNNEKDHPLSKLSEKLKYEKKYDWDSTFVLGDFTLENDDNKNDELESKKEIPVERELSHKTLAPETRPEPKEKTKKIIHKQEQPRIAIRRSRGKGMER